MADDDVQYALESAYTSSEAPAHRGAGGDAYSQSLDPPAISSFSDVDDGRTTAATNGEASDKLNAEESAALRSFLAGGDESGEGVVLDWGVVLPMAQAICLALAFLVVIVGLCTPAWKVRERLEACSRARQGAA